MTGNVLLIGFAVAGAAGFSVTASLCALGAFLAGAVIGGRLARHVRPVRNLLLVAMVIEAACTTTAAVIAGTVPGHRIGVAPLRGPRPARRRGGPPELCRAAPRRPGHVDHRADHHADGTGVALAPGRWDEPARRGWAPPRWSACSAAPWWAPFSSSTRGRPGRSASRPASSRRHRRLLLPDGPCRSQRAVIVLLFEVDGVEGAVAAVAGRDGVGRAGGPDGSDVTDSPRPTPGPPCRLRCRTTTARRRPRRRSRTSRSRSPCPPSAGRPTTKAFTVAGSPDCTKDLVRRMILELPLATGCETEADEAATPEPPGYVTDTV